MQLDLYDLLWQKILTIQLDSWIKKWNYYQAGETQLEMC